MNQAQDFMERVKSDAALREQVKGLGQNLQAVLDIAKREGYNFTQAEFEGALRERGYEVGAELSEADLEQVAGGTVVEVGKPELTSWPSC